MVEKAKAAGSLNPPTSKTTRPRVNHHRPQVLARGPAGSPTPDGNPTMGEAEPKIAALPSPARVLEADVKPVELQSPDVELKPIHQTEPVLQPSGSAGRAAAEDRAYELYITGGKLTQQDLCWMMEPWVGNKNVARKRVTPGG